MGFAGPAAPASVVARSRAPRSGIWGDVLFRWLVLVVAFSVGALLAFFLYVLTTGSIPAFEAFGWAFLTTNAWYPPDHFGAAAFIYGTAVTASLALLLGVPVSIGIAIFLNELAPRVVKIPLVFTVELLAAVPSVIYGLWAAFALAPVMLHYVDPALQAIATWRVGVVMPFGFLIPLVFPGNPIGWDKLTASVILALMIIPTVTAISREAFGQVPQNQREAAMSLGATQWETTRVGVIPFARTGIFAAVILGLGRAIGETMAVTMTIGNSNTITTSLLQPAQTIPSLLANEWGEAMPLERSALLELSLILLVVSLAINVVARLMLRRLVGGGKERE